MGLDTTHDCWHGAYSAFNRWRNKIAEVAGIPLDFMEGFYDPYDIPSFSFELLAEMLEQSPLKIYADRLREYHALLPICWDVLKPDVLYVLLNHSDCDGDIPADVCTPLADRLEELLPLLQGNGGGHVGNYRIKTEQFIVGLRLAAERGEAVEFR